MPVPKPAEFDALPSVTKLRSRPIVSFTDNKGQIWEIGWNGIWVKCWTGRVVPGRPPDPDGAAR